MQSFFAFGSLPSDDDDPKRDATTAPLLDTLAIAKAPSQEAAMVVKSPEAPTNKGTPARASKHLKKAKRRALPSTPTDRWLLLMM
jgi:hypothetical protein